MIAPARVDRRDGPDAGAGGGLDIKDGAGPGSPLPPLGSFPGPQLGPHLGGARFGLNDTASPAPDDRGRLLTDAELLDAVAQRVVKMGLTTPAVFFLESSKPLSYVGSQALVFLEPFVKSVLSVAYYDRFVALMEDRGNVERLIQRIEAADEAAQEAERARKRAEKAARGDEARPGWWRRLWTRRNS